MDPVDLSERTITPAVTTDSSSAPAGAVPEDNRRSSSKPALITKALKQLPYISCLLRHQVFFGYTVTDSIQVYLHLPVIDIRGPWRSVQPNMVHPRYDWCLQRLRCLCLDFPVMILGGINLHAGVMYWWNALNGVTKLMTHTDRAHSTLLWTEKHFATIGLFVGVTIVIKTLKLFPNFMLYLCP